MFKLYDAFKNIENEKDFNNFLIDLCTPAEIKDLNDRFKIAQLLEDGTMNQRDIAKTIQCSITTVTRVARFLNREKYGGYRKILKTLKNIQIHR